MNPSTLLVIIAALACPIGMGLMMWLMNKRMNSQPNPSAPGQTSEADRLTALNEQRRVLEQEIAEAERIAALGTRKEALTRGAPSDEAAAR